jgi:hypothetical protein
MNLNALAQRIHKLNEKWWIDLDTGERIERNQGELLCLIHSEISEAWEGEVWSLMDDHLPHRKMAAVEMADAEIRALDFAGGFNLDIDGAAKELPKAGWSVPGFTAMDKGAQIATIHQYVSSAMESARKGLKDGIIPSRSGLEVALAKVITLIHIYCISHKYDLPTVREEKLEYNQKRADHKIENRKAEGGKKW